MLFEVSRQEEEVPLKPVQSADDLPDVTLQVPLLPDTQPQHTDMHHQPVKGRQPKNTAARK